MSSITIGFIGLGGLLVLLALRVPVGFALTGVSLVGIVVVRGPTPALGVLKSMPYDFAAHWSLSAVPMFLLMGAIAYHSGLTGSLYSTMRIWVAGLPGGLAIATNLAAAAFAAASGSSLATAAAMGRLAVPEMLKYRYDPGLATGVVTAAGTLGALIPPSIMMVLYAVFAEQPVGKMLIAGLVPGLLTAVVYALMIWLRCWLKPSLAPPVTGMVPTWAERFSALGSVWPLPLLIIGVIGGIYSGVTTATEAGALGAFLALLIALAQRRLGWSELRHSVLEAVSSTASIFFIAIGAMLLTRFLAFTGMPFYLSGLVSSWGADPLLVLLLASLVYLVLGMFLDPLGLMLLTLPVLLPLFQSLNLDLIWIGVIVVKYLEIGLLTPPVGLNVYVVKGVVGDAVPLNTIFRGVAWFVIVDLLVLTFLVLVPEFTLWLPSKLN